MESAAENGLRYVDSHERSAEWLRLAIPLMSKQHAGLHPVSYAIWYEYVSGRNTELNREIDKRLQHGEVLTDLTAHALYYNYLSGPDEQRAEHVGVALHQMMAEVSSHTEQSAQRVSQYGQSLSQIGSRLGNRPERIEIRADIEWILKDTAAVMGTMSGLHELLNASRAEIARLRQELQRSKAEAETDALTGVLNRRAFDEVFETAIGHARAEGAPLCLALFDIDHFKNVNDSYGHVFGDKVLRSVAKVLKDGTKGADYVARFGGEEFAVLLPHTNLQNAVRVIETLRGGIAMGRVRDAKGDVLRKITASAGVGTYLENEGAEEFVARVDSALYESKRRGRNRVTVAP